MWSLRSDRRLEQANKSRMWSPSLRIEVRRIKQRAMAEMASV